MTYFKAKYKDTPKYAQRNLDSFMYPAKYLPPFAKEVIPEGVLLINSRKSSRKTHLSRLNMGFFQLNRLSLSSYVLLTQSAVYLPNSTTTFNIAADLL